MEQLQRVGLAGLRLFFARPMLSALDLRRPVPYAQMRRPSPFEQFMQKVRRSVHRMVGRVPYHTPFFNEHPSDLPARGTSPGAEERRQNSDFESSAPAFSTVKEANPFGIRKRNRELQLPRIPPEFFAREPVEPPPLHPLFKKLECFRVRQWFCRHYTLPFYSTKRTKPNCIKNCPKNYTSATGFSRSSGSMPILLSAMRYTSLSILPSSL